MRVPVAADRLAVLVVVAPGLLRVGDCAAVVEVAAAGCAAGLAFCGLRGGVGLVDGLVGGLVGGRKGTYGGDGDGEGGGGEEGEG